VKGLYDFFTRFFNPTTGLGKSKIGRGSSSFNGVRRFYSSGTNLNPLDVSNLYLGWSFGFAPLISDLQKISRALPKIRKNLRDLARNSTKPFTVTRVSTGSINFTYAPGINGYGPNPAGTSNDWWHENISVIKPPTRIVGVSGRRHLTYQTDEFQQLDYLMSRFVATGPVSLIWEKVPFSFVIDWFVDLSSLIVKLDNATVSTGKVISKSWSSESVDVIVGAVKHPQLSFNSHTSLDGSIIAQNRLSSYLRSPLKPDLLIQPSGKFGKKQASLTAALLHQQVANLMRRLKRKK
jgi:hypothetical protein